MYKNIVLLSVSLTSKVMMLQVRLSGQDSERGTFNQRHNILVDQESGAKYVSNRSDTSSLI